MREKSQDAYAIVDRHHDGAQGSQALAVVDGWRAPSDLKPSAVDGEDDRQPFDGARACAFRGRPYVQRQAVFVRRNSGGRTALGADRRVIVCSKKCGPWLDRL